MEGKVDKDLVTDNAAIEHETALKETTLCADKWCLFMQPAVYWLILSAADAVLLGSLGGTALHVDQMPRLAVTILVLKELLILAVISMLGTGPIILFQLFPAKHRRGFRYFQCTLSFVPFLVIFSLFAASWIQFHSTGRFLDHESILFFVSNPVQMLQHFAHMEPMLALAMPFVLLGCNFILVLGIIRMNRLSRGMRKRIPVYSLGLIFMFSFGIVGIQEPWVESRSAIKDPEAGMVYTLRELYLECERERSGPANHVFFDLRSTVYDKEEEIAASGDSPVEWKSILPMEEYLKQIDFTLARRWNVIVVVVESLRNDQLRAGGSTVDVMPNVEALAQSGQVYTGNYSQASHSNYADLCPLSSHYPLRSAQTHVYPKNPTYPRVLIYDILKAIGYRTAVISSQDENWGKMINYLDTGNIDHFFHSANYAGPLSIPHGDTGVESWVRGDKRSGKIDDRYTISEAIRWADPAQNDPFFIYLNLQESHVPYDTPADFPRRFGAEKLPCTLRFNQFPVDCAPLVKQAYSNSLAYVDYQLGRLIKVLQERGQWNNTIMIVTGDTGQAFYEHGFAAHANKLYDEVLRVPIVLHAPALEPRVKTGLVQHIDIAPTILELLSLPPHPSFQGKSLLSHDGASTRSAYLVVQAPLAHQYAIVSNGAKLIYDAQTKEHFLYDLRRDPEERFNVIEDQPDRYKELLRRLNTWRKLQIDYYSSIKQHGKWYPPVLKD